MAASVILVTGVILVGWSLKEGLTPWRLQDKDPRDMFELFICKPIPDSVRNIEASGTIAFAGGGAYITFEIDPEDVDLVIERGEFRPLKSGDPHWASDENPKSGEIIGQRLAKDNPSSTQSVLWISEDRLKCWFIENQY